MLELRFDLDVQAADAERRTIEGTIVPWNETATIAGVQYAFRPGSLRAGARTPLLLDHDRTRPIGVLAELQAAPHGALARFRVDATAAGDEALIQAGSGSRGAFSVLAAVTDHAKRADGVIDVVEAQLQEVSLLPLGAFAGATVTRVTAAATEPDPEPDPEPEPEPDPEPEPEDAMRQTVAAAADPPPVIFARADPPARELGAGELVTLIVRAQHGEPDARRLLVEAALAETISTDVSGLLPPTYERTVIGDDPNPRPLYETFRSRPLPGVGLQVNKPKWTTPPNGAWAVDVDADATTSKVIVGAQSATVQRWDWAGAIPWVVVQRSDPSIIDEIYAAAVNDFHADVEAKIYGELGAAAPGTSTSMGAAIAEFYVATGQKRAPEVIIMAPDVWGAYADAGALQVSLVQAGVSTSGDTLSTSFAGIRAITSGTLPAGEVVMATRRAVDARITEPVRLTANAIGALNVELAVVGEGLFDTDYPAELLKFAAIVPPVVLTTASRKS